MNNSYAGLITGFFSRSAEVFLYTPAYVLLVVDQSLRKTLSLQSEGNTFTGKMANYQVIRF